MTITVDAFELRMFIDEAVDRRIAFLNAVESYINVDQAAAHLGYADNLERGRRRVYDLTSARETNGFPVHKDGSRLLFRASELTEWLEGRA